jgi:solute carrier family 25 S-adenosylmethionine transporter 26
VGEGRGVSAFFAGVGPRALSNGLNSAVFFCFFEAIRKFLIEKDRKERAALLL